jgi:aminoacrylate hydrolase
MATVNSGGVEISYEVMGKDRPGVPVFVIAGLNGMRQACMKQAIPFSKERPVVLHDHRGTGLSGKPLGVYSIANMARDVIAIMDAEGIAKAHMVGTSTGGAIAQVLCLDFPDRVQSAAICCSWSWADPFFRRQFETRKEVLLAMGTATLLRMTSTTLNDPQWVAEHFDELAQHERSMLERASPPAVAAERIDALLAFDERARLSQIRTPVVLVASRNDVVCPAYFSEQMAKVIPGAELRIWNDGGHFFYQIYLDEFNSYIQQFMARHD